MDILEQIDAILLEDELDEGIKDLAKNTIISVLISIFLKMEQYLQKCILKEN